MYTAKLPRKKSGLALLGRREQVSTINVLKKCFEQETTEIFLLNLNCTMAEEIGQARTYVVEVSNSQVNIISCFLNHVHRSSSSS